MSKSGDLEKANTKLRLDEIAERQVTTINLDNIIYEGINTKNPKIVLMDYFWYKNYSC